MLPLWIIDITNKSERRDAFRRLVGQIEHVFVAESPDSAQSNNAQYNSERGEIDNNIEVSSIIPQYQPWDDIETPVNDDSNVISEDERRAARNAKIEGDYWYYSSYDMGNFFDMKDLYSNDANINDIATRLYKFQEAMVEDARKFIMTLRDSNSKPYQTINVVVLGDATEEFTQLVFPSVATILQKEKGRFISGHIHQGMSIIGMLYIPCDVNTKIVNLREKVLRLLREIEVQYNISTIRGYDNMMLYQNVQNRTECTYKRLNDRQLAEYLIQCLVHLYLACDINHPLLSGSGADDTFYFSMGATSVYFDMSVEDKNDANYVAINLLNTFKEDGDHAKTEIEVNLFDKDTIFSSDAFISNIHFDDIDLDVESVIRPPKPHPIKDWLHRQLKRVYYQHYLRFFPAELLRGIMQDIENSTSESLKKVYQHCASISRNAEKALPAAVTRVIDKSNINSGVLTFIEAKLKDMQEYLSKQKNGVQQSIQGKYWDEVLKRANNDSCFEDYHDTYVNDIRVKNSGAGCNALKQETLAKLQDLLSKEKTLMAIVSRCILLGIVCVLGVYPILNFISPELIDLGDVEKYKAVWYVLLFILPFIIQFISHLLYQRKKNNLIQILKKYYTHDAYSRIANRMESEATLFYNKMLTLVEEYLVRCKDIRNEVNIITPDPNIKLLFPQSLFNQPLNGGEFSGEPMILNADVERCRIKVNGKPEQVNNLTREQYHILIHHFKNGFARLFDGISITDSLARQFDEEIGDYVFIGHDEIVARKKEQWQQTKLNFNVELLSFIKSSMYPRMYPTIGEKLEQHRKKTGSYNTLEYMIAMAATNGEFSIQSDTEYADVKTNMDIDYHVMPYLPICTTKKQYSKYDELFKRYLFITRWRTYKKLSFNRLLPEEDFDTNMRAERVFEDEMIALNKKFKKGDAKKMGAVCIEQRADVISEQITEKETQYKRCLSSLILWATCPDDNSSEWLKLFNVEHFNEAFKERLNFRKIMNTND